MKEKFRQPRWLILTQIVVAFIAYIAYKRAIDDENRQLVINGLLTVELFIGGLYFAREPLEYIRIGATPRRVIRSVIMSYILVATIFGMSYAWLSEHLQDAFSTGGCGPSSSLQIGDALYFSFITISTVGYGDITPHIGPAKFLVVLEVLVGLLYNIILFASVSAYLFSRMFNPQK